LDNRELAVLLILIAAACLLVIYRPTRQALRPILETLKWKLLTIFVVYCLWLVGSLIIAWHIGIFSSKVWAAAVLWFLLAGIPLFGTFADVGKRGGLLRRQVLEAVGLVAVFEFIVNLQPFPVWIEIPLQLLLIFLAALEAYTSISPEFAQVGCIVRGLLALITVGIVLYVLVKLIGGWRELDFEAVLQLLVLPIWLTISAVPIVFGIGLLAAYESQLQRLRFFNHGQRPSPGVLVAIFAHLGLLPSNVSNFRAPYAQIAARSGSYKGAAAQIERWKRESSRQATEVALNRWRLARYAGQQGIDVEGRRVDRREFAETKAALRWLSTCQSLQYKRSKTGRKRYKADISDVVPDFELQGLPGNHGIKMRTRQDGLAWYAWRVTITGWVFAIGASGPTPSEWYFDGSKPPRDFPPANGWTSFMDRDRVEWRSEPRTS
jgi:hypothetical protein